MRNKKDIELFIKMVKQLNQAGFKAQTETAGVHIHVDLPKAYAAEVLLFYSILSLIDPSLRKNFAVSSERLNGNWITPLDKDKIDLAFEQIDVLLQTKNLSEIKKIIADRLDMAFHVLTRFNTLETRLFNSTLDANQLMAMIDFSNKLMFAVRTQKVELLNYLYRA